MKNNIVTEFESLLIKLEDKWENIILYLVLKNGHIYEHCYVKSINLDTKTLVFSSCYINTLVIGTYKDNLNVDYSQLEGYSLEELKN